MCQVNHAEVKGVKVKQADSLVILGTHFERDLLKQVNATKVVEKVSRKVDFWKTRRLTLMEKVLVIKICCFTLAVIFLFSFSTQHKMDSESYTDVVCFSGAPENRAKGGNEESRSWWVWVS